MTPKEFICYYRESIKFISDRLTDDYDLCMLNSYYSAAFRRAKKLPPIKKILSKRNKTIKQQSKDDLLKKIRNINAALGGTNT